MIPMKEKVTKRDKNLLPYASDLQLRIDNYLSANYYFYRHLLGN